MVYLDEDTYPVTIKLDYRELATFLGRATDMCTDMYVARCAD